MNTYLVSSSHFNTCLVRWSHFSYPFFEITNLFLKIVSLATKMGIDNLFYYNFNLKILNSKNINFEEYEKY